MVVIANVDPSFALVMRLAPAVPEHGMIRSPRMELYFFLYSGSTVGKVVCTVQYIVVDAV